MMKLIRCVFQARFTFSPALRTRCYTTIISCTRCWERCRRVRTGCASPTTVPNAKLRLKLPKMAPCYWTPNTIIPPPIGTRKNRFIRAWCRLAGNGVEATVVCRINVAINSRNCLRYLKEINFYQHTIIHFSPPVTPMGDSREHFFLIFSFLLNIILIWILF